MILDSKLRSLELFAGAGGLGLGLAHAGVHASAFVEADPWCCKTLIENKKRHFHHHDDPEIIEALVSDLDQSAVRNSVDVLSGGPPCQPFSYAGRHHGYEDKRNLFPEFHRFLKLTKPKAFVIENVPGLLRQSFREYFDYILLQLKYPEIARRPNQTWFEHLSLLEKHDTSLPELGLVYKVYWKLVNAADFGVPQNRKRLFIVGVRADIDAVWAFSEPTTSQAALVWDKLYGDYWERHNVPNRSRNLTFTETSMGKKLSANEKPKKHPWITVRKALGGLPDLVPQSHPPLLSGHVFRPGAREYKGHTGSNFDEPAKTLKAGVNGVPGGENMVRLDNGDLRYFSVRECLRLQTFPDDYEICGSWTRSMRQIGNAVPVELARQLGLSIVKVLAKFPDVDAIYTTRDPTSRIKSHSMKAG
jgi:DNA (cytosine-5)-methyltransferase 1